MKDLTKDADKLICCIYKSYLEKRKNDISKFDAKHFDSDFYKEIKVLSSWQNNDISDTLSELKHADLIKLYIRGSFSLNDSAIIYMENRFKNGLSEITDFILKFI